jgi:hypothetical protein
LRHLSGRFGSPDKLERQVSHHCFGGAKRNDWVQRGARPPVASEVSDPEERLRSTYTGPVHLVQPYWPVLEPAFAGQPEPVRLDGLTGTRPGKGLDPVSLIAKACG